MDEVLKLLRETIAKAELAHQEYQNKARELDQKLSIFEERLYQIKGIEDAVKAHEADLEQREVNVRRHENLGEAESQLENARIEFQKSKESFEKWKQDEELRLRDLSDQLTVRRKKLDELMQNDVVRRHLKGIENA